MKPVLLTLSFLLLAFPLAFSDDAEQVVDTDGNPIVPGGEYFIVANLLGQPLPGKVALGKTGNSTCDVTVEVYFGLYGAIPVKFVLPAANPNNEVYTDVPLDIGFTKEPNCVESSKWVVFLDSDGKQAYVGIGGPEDHPGQKNFDGTFSLRKSSGKRYSLVFCSPIEIGGSKLCWNVGYHFVDGTLSLLVLTKSETGFQFALKKVDSFPGIRTVV